MLIASVASDIAAWVGVIAVAVSAVIAAASYGRKAEAERAETDVQLIRAFAELVPIANGRGPGHLSDEVVRGVLAGHVAGEDVDPHGKADLGLAVIPTPVGRATQAAVLLALGELARRHSILRRPVRAALSDMLFVRDFVDHTGQSTPLTAAYDEAVRLAGGDSIL
jgi:hypothetical protein